MKVEIKGGFEIRWSESTVWVTAPDGGTLGRFSRWGMDIHKPTRDQLAKGVACDHCTHELPGRKEWEGFLIYFKVVYKLVIPAAAEPSWLPATNLLAFSKKRPSARRV